MLPATHLNSMKLKTIFCIILTALIHASSFSQEPKADRLIIGTWNYDIAYDTIAVAVTNNIIDTSVNHQIFISRLKIKKKEAVLFEGQKRLKSTWVINGSNEISFLLNDGRVLKYTITALTPHSLELKELGILGSTLGYKKK